MRHGIWATLGLDPTSDRSAIRRAYAARLKAMDVDADPAGFAALRAARDAALAAAAEPALPDAAVPTPPSIEQPAVEPSAEPDPDPELTAFHEAIDAHFHALQSLLFPGHDDPPTAEELAAIDHHGRALLADPRLEQVDFAASAERWFAEILSASIPRSDPLLEPAAAMFGWIDRRDDYALPTEAVAIVERIGAMRFATLLSDPKHRLHKAWRELNRGGGRRAPLWNPKGPRRELMALIRTRFPMVESWLEPPRVADVDDPNSAVIGVPVWLIIFAIVTGLRIFASFGANDRPSPPPPINLPDPASQPGAGSDSAPTPVSAPESEKPQFVFASFISGLTHAPTSLIRDVTEWELRAMRYYRPFDPAQCVDTTIWRYDGKLAQGWDSERIRLKARIRETARDEMLPLPSRRFRLASSIVEDVLRRTGFDQARFERSLGKGGDIADQCKVQIAIREAALANPKAGNTLLRQLQLAGFGE